ncbi:nitrilase-related carbon-nitrogen hydrolase [Pseudomonas typographi]|uniref:Amidohydrolase n=1 Tax=Pseudomonas typographi TaxID=2715964 RepID=A0ABR7Z2Y5_9PSED|nr:nitrilase-related carbon-nitrogen hydrolase [Pseudomonas typographi]MBD1599850.1 amidohydrolase [Pseudomonas typographi]
MNEQTQYTAAAVQFEPLMFEKARNIERLSELVIDAARQGAKLIATPEMGITGYCWLDREEVRPMVETIPGPTTEHFHQIAREHDCYIVIGLPEVDPLTGLYYNSAALIGPQGVVGTHRKTHPYIAEPKWAVSGDKGHQVFDTPIGRIAVLICMDIHFIETARLAGVGQADVICHISAWLAERAPAPYWISRAMENHCYLLESNRWGLERTVQFSGGSCLIEPDGKVAATRDTGDGLVLGEIDLSRTRARPRLVKGQAVFQDRRPQLYATLMTDTYSWNPSDFFPLYGMNPLSPGKASHIAVAQMAPSEEVEQNLQAIERLVAQASAEQRCDVLVFPERALTGLQDRGTNSLPVPGAVTDKLVALATRYRLHIVVGLAELAGTRRYNSAILVGPEGLVGTYRQIHLRQEDCAWATPGERWASFDIPAGRLGLLIGYDAYFPEAGRVLSLSGCDLIAVPSAEREGFFSAHPGSEIRQNYPIPTGADPLHWHHYRVRAGENNVYLAFANVASAALNYPGASGVFGPDTFEFPRREAIVARGASLAVLAVDTSSQQPGMFTRTVRRKDLVSMRLPHHYVPLVLSNSSESE